MFLKLDSRVSGSIQGSHAALNGWGQLEEEVGGTGPQGVSLCCFWVWWEEMWNLSLKL